MATTLVTTNLQRLKARLRANAPIAAEAGAAELAKVIFATVPVRKGDLQKSVTSHGLPAAGDVYRAESTAGSGLPDNRASLTNYGTTTRPAQHWLERSNAQATPAVATAIRDAMKAP